MMLSTFFGVASLYALQGASALPQLYPRQNSSSWPGWAGIKYLFVFGDSYTQTGFEVDGTQPSAGNPLGNPTYPGYTSSNGPNWVDFLTTVHNSSLVLTYNLAYGGATVDGDLVAPYEPTVLSVKQQVQDEFLPTYGSHPASAPWTSGETLVAVWIGINDIGNSYWSQNSTLNPTIFAELSDLVESVYQTGAKNFLFLNVPPVERSPLTQSQGDNTEQGVKLEKADIADWNARVEDMAKNLTTAHADATTFVFDTYALFNQVLDDPSSTPETAIYQNTTDYCDAYQNGTSDPDSYDASCGIPVNEYFWLNSLHPTYPVHNATAREIAELLS